MKSRFLAATLLTLGMLAMALGAGAAPQQYHGPEPQWNPSIVKPCDRACLIGIMDGYMDAIFNMIPTLCHRWRSKSG